jgi:crotonobetainyl-CoA:carnitine CoA-transferase CaiB-like acyl-CoA transferase
VVLDLKHPKGLEAMQQLLSGADVFLHNLRPMSIDGLGLGYDQVRSLNPRIIWCGAYGYGERGPYAGRPAYDDLIQGAAGIADLHGRAAQGSPRYMPLAIADRIAALHAVHSISMALFARERTGRGCRIDVPMFETLASVVLSDHLYGRTFEPAEGASGYVRLLSYGRRPYATRDGYICALVYNDGHWRRFLNAIGREDLMADPRFVDLASRTRHIDHVYAFLSDKLEERATNEWLAVFAAIDVPAMPLHSVDSLLEDPHIKAVDLVPLMEHPTEGAIRMPRVPVDWNDHQPGATAPAPRLGEHTVSVLKEQGFSDSVIASLLDSGAARASEGGRSDE